jgi:hypothetical protein
MVEKSDATPLNVFSPGSSTVVNSARTSCFVEGGDLCYPTETVYERESDSPLCDCGHAIVQQAPEVSNTLCIHSPNTNISDINENSKNKDL